MTDTVFAPHETEPELHEKGVPSHDTSTGVSNEKLGMWVFLGSAFYTLTGFHGMHVSVGIVLLLSLFVMSVRGNLGAERAETVEIFGLYWHFVDIVWILIFTIVYLIP